MVGVQEDDEHPCARILKQHLGLGDRIRLDALLLRHAAANRDVLECGDGLRFVVFQHLEVVAAEIGDRDAVHGGIDIDPNIARIASEGWLRGILETRIERRGGHEGRQSGLLP